MMTQSVRSTQQELIVFHGQNPLLHAYRSRKETARM